jgi:hypothetical protein
MNRPTGKWTMPRLLTMFVDHILKGKEKETSSEQEVDVRKHTHTHTHTHVTDMHFQSRAIRIALH